MAEPLSDRLLDILGDSVARGVLLSVLREPRSRTQLVADLGVPQSVISRTVTTLLTVALIESEGGTRGALLRPTAPDELLGLLLAADHLAQALIDLDLERQRERTRSDRRQNLTAAGTDEGS